jgi:formylglycine-generating enzyme required for sulfatase activity
VPTRDHDGRLRIDDGTGLVFVLLPGGAFRMGATPMDAAPDPAVTNRDQMAREDEQPEHTVTLAPFFLSKYEMTQAQWQRFLGRNPSQFRAGTWRGEWRASWRHPVETVSWVTCDEVMRAMRLALPTEAQWEYAARAGSGAQFGSHGEGKTALIGAVNALDRQTAQLFRSQADTDFGADFDDGQGALAAVGTFAANAFGLHDMFGNVMEWCADRFCTYSDPTRPGDGLRDGRMAHGRVLRGGSYVFGAAELRVAHRMSATDWTSAAEVGLRPARAVER